MSKMVVIFGKTTEIRGIDEADVANTMNKYNCTPAPADAECERIIITSAARQLF